MGHKLAINYCLLTLSLRYGIWLIFVHEGPLFDTRTSHVAHGRLKCDAHAFLRFSSVSSLYSNETNSRG